MDVSTARCAMPPSNIFEMFYHIPNPYKEYIFMSSMKIPRQFVNNNYYENVQNIIHPVDTGWVYSSEKYESSENTCRKMFLHIVLYCGHLRGGFCLMQRTNVASQRNSQNKLMLVPCRRDICVFNKKMNTIFSRYGPQNRPSDVDLKARNTGLIKATDPKKNCPRYQE